MPIWTTKMRMSHTKMCLKLSDSSSVSNLCFSVSLMQKQKLDKDNSTESVSSILQPFNNKNSPVVSKAAKPLPIMLIVYKKATSSLLSISSKQFIWWKTSNNVSNDGDDDSGLWTENCDLSGLNLTPASKNTWTHSVRGEFIYQSDRSTAVFDRFQPLLSSQHCIAQL